MIYKLIKKLLIKRNNNIGKGVLLKGNNIFLGKGTYINGPGTVLHGSDTFKISIGNYCSISWGVSIISKNKHNYKNISTNGIFMRKFTKNSLPDLGGDVIIGHDVWIGCNTVILPGIKIGNGAIVGAGSIVTKNIPKYAIVGGNPAKIIKFRFNKKIIDKLMLIDWNTINKEEVKILQKNI